MQAVSMFFGNFLRSPTLKRVAIALSLLVGLCAGAALAGGGGGASSTVTLSAIATNIGKSVTSLSIILEDTALIAGIGFILASFFKFHQHKMNPQQAPMSQGITLLLIGAGLTLFPVLIPTAATVVVGTGQTLGTISGGAITSLISG